MEAVHFGAGNIGRGFIGERLEKSGYNVCFIDVNEEIVNRLKQNRQYTVELMDKEHTSFVVKNVTALNSLHEQEKAIQKIIDADLITTSVGTNNLQKIAPLLAEGLLKHIEINQKSINVIANENTINASDLLKNEVRKVVSEEEWKELSKLVSFVNSAIDRQSLSRKTESEEIALVEPYFEWIIDRNALFNDGLPPIEGATYVTDLAPFIERKLYIVNAGHAAAAYVGSLYGKETIQEALADRGIKKFVEELMRENARYLMEEYEMDKKELDDFIVKTLKRHGNPNIRDEIKRVARSPIRKLGVNERVVGPLRKLVDKSLSADYGKELVAVILLYKNLEDPEVAELQNSIQSRGVKYTISKYTHLDNESIINGIEEQYKKMQQKKAK